MPKPLTKITKKQFIAAMEEGWRKLEWIDGIYWAAKDGRETEERRKAAYACAIGAAAYALNMMPWNLHDFLSPDVATASNAAGSKKAAITAIKRLPWRSAP